MKRFTWMMGAVVAAMALSSGPAYAQVQKDGQIYSRESVRVSGQPAGNGEDGQDAAGMDAAGADAGQAARPVIFGRGSYVIGRDMPAGEYAVFTEDVSANNGFSSCTFTLYKNDMDEKKIGTFSFQHHGLVTLYNGQHLILSKGYAVPADQAGISPGTTGMYKAGRDMEPGIYRLTPMTSDGAHYALYSDVRYYYDYMDDYQTFSQPVTVTLEEGQYLELFDVSSVEKI